MRMKVPILSDLSIINTLFLKCKMNEIVNKFALARDKSMPEIQLK